MNRLVMLTFLVAVLTSGTSTTCGEDPITYSLRVTSSLSGKEVEFEAAYLFNGSNPVLQVVRQSTPFETRADGEIGMGIFRKTGGDGQLVVELVAARGDKQLPSHRASGDAVVFGENLVKDVPSFTKAFSWKRP